MITALVALVVTFAATPAARAIALRSGWLDIPNARSSHVTPTPRVGGLAIVVGAAVAMVCTVRLDPSMGWLLAATAAMAAMGATDDVRTLPSVLRLVLQFTAAGLVMSLTHLSLPPAGVAWSGASAPIVAAVLTALWIVGTTNAYNFMDGINGIASCQAVVAAVALAVLAGRHGDLVSAGVLAALGGAAAGFLPWNMPRASIFMGDAGSAMFGFAFAAIIVRLSMTSTSFIAAALPLAPFLLDASATLARRIVRREPILQAHRSHFYQRLVALGASHTAATATWTALAAASAAGAILYDQVSPASQWGILAGVVAVHAAVAGVVLNAERRPRMGETPTRARGAR